MQKTTLAFSLIAMLFSITMGCNCNSSTNSSQATVIDSAASPTAQSNQPPEKDTVYTDPPFININQFDTPVGNSFFDSLHKAYTAQATALVVKDICTGDYCQSRQTFLNKNENAVLYFIKGNSGEYGFSNNQYFLTNDSLRVAREFYVSIEAWPTDSTATLWKIQETVHTVYADSISCMQRTAYTQTHEGFDYILKNVPRVAADEESRKTYAGLIESMQELTTMKGED